MTHFVHGVDQIVQCPPHRGGMERPLVVEMDYASGDAARPGVMLPPCIHDDANGDQCLNDVSL